MHINHVHLYWELCWLEEKTLQGAPVCGRVRTLPPGSSKLCPVLSACGCCVNNKSGETGNTFVSHVSTQRTADSYAIFLVHPLVSSVGKRSAGLQRGMLCVSAFYLQKFVWTKTKSSHAISYREVYFYCTVYISLLVDITSHSAFASLALFILTDEFHLSLASMLF
jgi:hypothetical protein